MGETAARAAKREADNAKIAPTQQPTEPDQPTCRHDCPTIPCRHTRTEEKHKKIIDDGLRGVPLVGAGPGCIKGTRPGDSAAALEHAGRDIVRSRLHRNRFKPSKQVE